MRAKSKQLGAVCFDCAQPLKTKDKSVMGVWNAICGICGEMRSCADAAHDFGIYLNEKEKLKDLTQDQL